MYARWLKPRSLSWLMSVTRPTRICLLAVVVPLFELFEPPPQPAARTTRSGRSRSRRIRGRFTTVERKPRVDATTATRPRPEQVTLAVVFQVRDGRLHVLLWERGREPQRGFWALPGGYLDAGETLEQSIRRHLAQKVDVRELSHLEQLETRSDPGRNPRAWQLTTAYLGLVPSDLDPELPGVLPLPLAEARDHRPVRGAPASYALMVSLRNASPPHVFRLQRALPLTR